MGAVLRAFGRSLVSQFNGRILLITLPPFLLAMLLWGSILWLVLQPVIDVIQRYFVDHDGYSLSGKWLTILGLSRLKTVIVPLLAMWVLVPLMVATAFILVGTMAAPAIIQVIAIKHYSSLECRQGGTFAQMLMVAISSLLIFVSIWIVTIPLCALPLVGFVIQPLLWGWLAYRVMAYAVLTEYADARERRELLHSHRWALLAIGTLTGALAVTPTLLWLGRTMSIVLFPIFAVLSLCLYVIVLTFSILWFHISVWLRWKNTALQY